MDQQTACKNIAKLILAKTPLEYKHEQIIAISRYSNNGVLKFLAELAPENELGNTIRRIQEANQHLIEIGYRELTCPSEIDEETAAYTAIQEGIEGISFATPQLALAFSHMKHYQRPKRCAILAA